MLTRSRSSSSSISVDDSEDVSSQSSSQVSRQLSSTSSYFDSQDSAPIDGYLTKRKAIKKTKLGLPESYQRVMILPDAVFKSSSKSATPQLMSLPHPKTELSQQLFLLSGDCSTVCEINRCTEQYRSWFIGESVQTDGSLTICTPIDPLLIVLPLIKSFKLDKFTTIEALLSFDTTPHAHTLSDLVAPDQWLNICDKKVMGDSICVYRYNKEKTMKWLTKKVKLLSAKLITDDVYIGNGSRTFGFRQNKKDSQLCTEEYLHYASGMMGEYLPTDLCNELLTMYPSTLKTTKRKISPGPDENNEPSSKKPCSVEPTEDYTNSLKTVNTKTKPVSKLTAGLRALEKVDKKGMKSIKNFFCKNK